MPNLFHPPPLPQSPPPGALLRTASVYVADGGSTALSSAATTLFAKNYPPSGGATAGGAATTQFLHRAIYSASGGATAGGAAQAAASIGKHTYAASGGGILTDGLLGAATLKRYQRIWTADGGTEALGGAASTHFAHAPTYAASGGTAAGGAATASTLHAPTYAASGGVQAAGAALTSKTFVAVYAASGGAIAAGAATTATVFSGGYAGAGGVALAGAATTLPLLTHPYTGVGGPLAIGMAATSAAYTHPYAATGGLSAGGIASTQPALLHPYAADGGASALAGAATTAWLHAPTYAASGGSAAGSAATTSTLHRPTYAASGGATAAGAAQTASATPETRSYTGTGGAAAGSAGNTRVLRRLPYTGVGGGQLGGAAARAVHHAHPYVASGGLQSGSAATTSTLHPKHPYVASGGPAAAGSAQTHGAHRPAYLAAGGVQTASAAATRLLVRRPYVAVGGTSAGGAATTACKLRHPYAGSGRTVTAGAAQTVTIQHTHRYQPLGGAVVAGAAAHSSSLPGTSPQFVSVNVFINWAGGETNENAYLRQCSINRGRAAVNDSPGPASATIVLRNDSGRFSPYGGAVGSALGVRVIVQAVHKGTVSTLFWGNVAELHQDTHLSTASVTLLCLDPLERLRLTYFPAPLTPYVGLTLTQIANAIQLAAGVAALVSVTLPAITLRSYLPSSGSLLQALQQILVYAPGYLLWCDKGGNLQITAAGGLAQAASITSVETMTLEQRTGDLVTGYAYTATAYRTEPTTVQVVPTGVTYDSGTQFNITPGHLYPLSPGQPIGMYPGVTATVTGTVPLPSASDGTVLQLLGGTNPTSSQWFVTQTNDPTSPTVASQITAASLNTTNNTFSISIKNTSANQAGTLQGYPWAVSAYVQLSAPLTTTVGAPGNLIGFDFTQVDQSNLTTAVNLAAAVATTQESVHPRITITMMGKTDPVVTWLLGLDFQTYFILQDTGADLPGSGAAPWLSRYTGTVVVEQIGLTINVPTAGQPQLVGQLVLFDQALATV